VTASGALILASLILFLFFFSRCVFNLRPVAVAALVAKDGRLAFNETTGIIQRADVGVEPPGSNVEPTEVVRTDGAGVIQAIHLDGLVRWAREHDAQIVLVHAVGDFVPTGETLVAIYGGGPGRQGVGRELNGMIALGDERTVQQDPAFAIRIMVDIALMALSPAVNAPTTATQVLGHLGELLRMIGSADLRPGARGALDARPAVVMPVRRWEDYLTLGITEIREYGASGIQVMRALRATLEDLRQDVRVEHRAAVEEELARLDTTLAAHWSHSIDLDRAGVTDRQGIGGPGRAKRVGR